MSVEVIKYGNLPKAVQEGNQAAIIELVTRVTAQAKALAPVDFGQLKNSIMGRVKGEDYGFNKSGGKSATQKLTERADEGEGFVGSALLHAIYNEFGTRKMAAQPFLRPAVGIEANGAKAKRLITQLQNKAVKDGMRKGPRKKKVIK